MSWRDHPWGVPASVVLFTGLGFAVAVQLLLWGLEIYCWWAK